MATIEEPQTVEQVRDAEEEDDLAEPVKSMSFRSLASTSAPTTIEDDDLCDAESSAEAAAADWQEGAVPDWQLPSSVLLFLDWDDTLFPTSWLDTKPGFREWSSNCEAGHPFHLDDADQAVLSELDVAAAGFLRAASQLGKVVCVTLAQPCWVPACLEAFMPNLSTAWRELNVQVHYSSVEKLETRRIFGPQSAWCIHRLPSNQDEDRHMHAEVHTHRKQRSMKRALRQFYGKHGAWSNVLSFGDGPFERQALQDLAFERSGSPPPSPSSEGGAQEPETHRVKTVKMLDSPACVELCKELQMLQDWLARMVSVDDDFDLDLADADGPRDLDVQCKSFVTAEE